MGVASGSEAPREARWRTILRRARKGCRPSGIRLVACAFLLSFPALADAQELHLKPATPSTDSQVPCPAAPLQAERAAVATRSADSLLAAANRAAILGDHEVARELFSQAAGLDPLNPVVSYRLARTLDDLGDAEGAVLEYCRYLRIAPTGQETAAARERLQALLAAGAARTLLEWNAAMRSGSQAYEGGDYQAATDWFTRAIELDPQWPDAHYNRALAQLAAGGRASAARDLERYLALSPFAADRGDVRLELQSLQATPAQGPVRQAVGRGTPGQILVQGLLIPGLGQHSTGRTPLGVVVLGGVGGALYLGLQEETVVRTRGAEDPFGNYYEYEVTARERPNLVPGIGAAVAIAVAGAVEGYLYASRRQARLGAPVSLGVTPGETGVRLELRVNPPGL